MPHICKDGKNEDNAAPKTNAQHPLDFLIDRAFSKNNIKSSLNTCGITLKRVTNGGVHFCGLAPGQHSSEETWQRWRVVGDTESDVTGPGIEP